MAWAHRGNHRYYYRAFRSQGKAKSNYLGSGPAAELAATVDAQRQSQRAATRQAMKTTRLGVQQADCNLLELAMWAETLVQVRLVAGGFHRHERGPWRRWRNAR